MRLNDLNDGSIKTLLILALLLANLALNLPGDSASRIFPGSARASRAALGASRAALGAPPSAQGARGRQMFSARAPKTAREARALPDPLQP